MRTYKYFVAVLFILFAFDAAHGCSCMKPGPPCAYYGKADAIFLGRVVGSVERKAYPDENGNKIIYDVGTIRFLIQENYKGAPGYEIEIHSGTGGGDCGYWFLRNESYVVYAYRSSEDNKFYTNICTRTAPVSQAADDLAYLRGLANAKAGATLYGELWRYFGDPEHGPVREASKMSGVKVIVTGEGKTYETVTNDEGEYRVTGLPPGDYDAFPELPETLGAESNRDKQDDYGRFTKREPVHLVERSCGELSFYVQFSGKVSGKVVDASGEPAKKVQVNLVWGDDDEKEATTWTDDDGKYEFTMVQPGNYLLGFNLRWAPDAKDPYPRTFYPGVKTRTEASLITVGEGEKLKGYDMTLPPRLRQRQLKVAVVWPDGRPAAGANLYFEINTKSFGEQVKTDNAGTASLNLFENYTYIIYAEAKRGDGFVYAAPVAIPVDEDVKPLKLVLAKEGMPAYKEIEALKRKTRN
jgi:5-hydroxyisourate hydrolase-like protein (transthyretin family)